MNCHATFLINGFAAGRAYLDFLLGEKIPPEIGMEHGGLDFPPDKHRDLARELADNGLSAALHLPFFGVLPGGADKKQRRKAVDILLRGVEIANIYGACHLIGHPEFAAPYYSGHAGNAAMPSSPDEGWLERSAQAWLEVLSATEARLYLENTDDQTPDAVLALLERLPARAAMCFDVGHWFFAAGGRDRRNLGEWLGPMIGSGRLAHLHLHDNDGQADRHWALGRGGIDFARFFAGLEKCAPPPTFTLESHSLPDLKESLRWLGENDSEPAKLK